MKSPFVISAHEGRWPNRHYTSVMPGDPLFNDGTKEEYIDWLYENADAGHIAPILEAMAEAIMADVLCVRVIVPDRFNDFRGNAVINLVKIAINAAT